MVKRRERKAMLIIGGDAEGGRQGQIAHRLNMETVVRHEAFLKLEDLFYFSFKAVK